MLTKNIDILRKDVFEHLADNALVKSVNYWTSAKNNVGGKGSFIGCLTHSSDPSLALERFGLPIAVLRIAENISGMLPDDDGKAFFAALPDAIGCNGKDLSKVHWAFFAAELRTLPEVNAAVQATIDRVISGVDLLATGNDWPKDAAVAAADAVRATYATDTATYAAIAVATYAACAEADAYSAYVAAYFARSRKPCRVRQRDTLLHLIAVAPVPSYQK